MNGCLTVIAPRGAGITSGRVVRDRQRGELEVLRKSVWEAPSRWGTCGMLRPEEAVMGPGCLLPTGSLCPLHNPCACQTAGPSAPNPYTCPCLPTGSKTREGVVQGVASGTSPALARPLSLPQADTCWFQRVGVRWWKTWGCPARKACPGSLQGSGHLGLLHPGSQPLSPTLSLL